MKKLIYSFLSLIMVFTLASCSTETQKVESSGPLYHDRPSFETIEGLVEHLNSEDIVKGAINKKAEDERSLESDMLYMYTPSFKPEGFYLSSAALSSSWIYYKYYKEGYPPESSIPSGSSKQQKDTVSSRDSAVAPRPSSDSEPYISDNIVTDSMMAEIRNSFSIGWNYTSGSGIGSWEKFAQMNSSSVFELEGHPGVYYSNTPYKDQVYGKMLYWTQDGYAFQAGMSLKVFESITFSEEGLPQLVQPVDYSTVTFEAIE